MDTNRKTLVVAALILVLSLVAFNLNIGDLSGRATGSSSTSIKVAPSSQTCDNIDQGGVTFSVTVENPGSVPTRSTLIMRDASGGNRIGEHATSTSSQIHESVTNVLRRSCEKGCFYLEAVGTKGGSVAVSNTVCVQ